MAVKRRTVESSAMNTNIWTIENELKLFKAALKYKPAGIMKHLNMALIYNELLKSGMKEVTPATIWDRLAHFYNLDAADKIEQSLPKLTETESEFCEFQLPKKDFQNIMNETLKKSVGGAGAAGSETKETVEQIKVEVKEPEVTVTTTGSNKKAGSASSSTNSGTETPKSAIKRPLRSTPGSTGGGSSAKRRK